MTLTIRSSFIKDTYCKYQGPVSVKPFWGYLCPYRTIKASLDIQQPPPFNSRDFKLFLKHHHVKHATSSPSTLSQKNLMREIARPSGTSRPKPTQSQSNYTICFLMSVLLPHAQTCHPSNNPLQMYKKKNHSACSNENLSQWMESHLEVCLWQETLSWRVTSAETWTWHNLPLWWYHRKLHHHQNSWTIQSASHLPGWTSRLAKLSFMRQYVWAMDHIENSVTPQQLPQI